MDDNKVRVITAGGAGGASSSAKKKKKSKKSTTKSHTTTTASGGGDGGSSTGASGKREASTRLPERIDLQNPTTTVIPSTNAGFSMEMEHSDRERDDLLDFASSPTKSRSDLSTSSSKNSVADESFLDEIVEPVKMETLIQEPPQTAKTAELFWLFLCFLGIMVSFVVYGVLLEYTTSGGRKLHELSFLFVTSALYTITAAAGRYVRAETPTTIPPARFAILGLTSMGSTFCSVRSLRYVRCVLSCRVASRTVAGFVVESIHQSHTRSFVHFR